MELSSKINALSSASGKEKQLFFRYAPALLTALLVIWVASKFVNLTWLLLDKPTYDAQLAPDSTVPVEPQKPSGTIEAVRAIQSRHLFGEYVAPAVPAGGDLPSDPVDVPEIDPAELTLKGTVASTSDSNGLAIVEHRGEEKVFTIGDEITPGMELRRVFAQEIHVSQRGKISKILLPKAKDASGTGRSSAAARPSRPTRAANSRSSAPKVTRSSLPTKLGDLIRPQPVFQDGQQLGYRVYPGRKRDQFKALGLKPGDLVTEINGTPLNDPSRGLEIFRSLNESTQVSVSIQRNGAQTSLVLDTTQLNLQGQD